MHQPLKKMLEVRLISFVFFFVLIPCKAIMAIDLGLTTNVERFINEINSAYKQNREIDWSIIEASQEFSSSFDKFWNITRFNAHLNEDEIKIEKPVLDRILVKNILVSTKSSSKEQSLHLVLDSTHALIDFYFGIPIGLEKLTLNEANNISYLESARAIIRYLDKLQSAFLKEDDSLDELALSFDFIDSVFPKVFEEAILLPHWDIRIENVELYGHHKYSNVYGVRLYFSSNELPVFENAVLFLLFDIEDVEIKNVQVMSLQYLDEIKDDDDYFGIYDFDIVK